MQLSKGSLRFAGGAKEGNIDEKRAKSVYDLMMELGIDGQRVSYRGYSNSQPMASPESEGGEHLNRRVEFVLDQY